MNKHTPGPWRAGKGVDDDPTRCFVTQAIKGQPHYLIAEIHNGAPGDCLETEEANARLIAAAPELLAALKAGHQKLLTYGACYQDDKELHKTLIPAWEAAIAKAEAAPLDATGEPKP